MGDGPVQGFPVFQVSEHLPAIIQYVVAGNGNMFGFDGLHRDDKMIIDLADGG